MPGRWDAAAAVVAAAAGDGWGFAALEHCDGGLEPRQVRLAPVGVGDQRPWLVVLGCEVPRAVLRGLGRTTRCSLSVMRELLSPKMAMIKR